MALSNMFPGDYCGQAQSYTNATINIPRYGYAQQRYDQFYCQYHGMSITTNGRCPLCTEGSSPGDRDYMYRREIEMLRYENESIRNQAVESKKSKESKLKNLIAYYYRK